MASFWALLYTLHIVQQGVRAQSSDSDGNWPLGAGAVEKGLTMLAGTCGVKTRIRTITFSPPEPPKAQPSEPDRKHTHYQWWTWY